MAGVTGPGGTYIRPRGTMCDLHPDREATHSVLVERDSFGAEYADLCDACYAAHLERRDDQRVGKCEICGRTSRDLLGFSDPFDRYDPPSLLCHACYNRCQQAMYDEINMDLDWYEAPRRHIPIPEDDIVSEEWVYAYELERLIRMEHADPGHTCLDAGCPYCHPETKGDRDYGDLLIQIEEQLIARDERRARTRYERRMRRRRAAA